MKHILFLLTLLFTTHTFPEGFAAGTKIKTERAYVPIEHILKGEKLFTAHSENIHLELIMMPIHPLVLKN